MANRTILHVIPTLASGGAEGVLTRLVSNPDHSSFAHKVLLLRNIESSWRDELETAGVPVMTVSAGTGTGDPLLLPRLVRILRHERPAVVQTWMYHADLIGGLAAKLGGAPPVAWNIRNGTLAPTFSKPRTLQIAKVNARLSRVVPAEIVCCAESAKRIHVALGYAEDRMTVIPNGYDLDLWRPNSRARATLRASLGIPESATVIGLVARFHPQKDHATFFKAAAMVGQRFPDAHFLLCGRNVTLETEELREMVEKSGLGTRCHLIGEQRDVSAVHASVDISCLCSQGGEGFPNTVAEAMACESPCIVTDVGDAALIVGETGRVCPIGDVHGLADAMSEMLCLSPEERQALGRRARQRIQDRFGLQQMRERYDLLYQRLADRLPADHRHVRTNNRERHHDQSPQRLHDANPSSGPETTVIGAPSTRAAYAQTAGPLVSIEP